MAVAGMLSASAQANLLWNGDFETGTFDGWWSWQEDPGTQTASIDTEYNPAGSTASLKMWSDNSAWTNQVGQDIAIGEGVDITVSFDYSVRWTTAGSASVGIDYKDAGWAWLATDSLNLYYQAAAPNGEDEWLNVSGNFTTPAGTEHITLTIYAADATTVNFDNFDISVVPEPTAMTLMALGSTLLIRRRR